MKRNEVTNSFLIPILCNRAIAIKVAEKEREQSELKVREATPRRRRTTDAITCLELKVVKRRVDVHMSF